MIPRTTLQKFNSFLHFFTSDRKLKAEPIVDLASFRAAFNPQLSQYLSTKVGMYKGIISTELIHQTLEHVVSLVMQGGKRVRPYMVYLAYRMEGGVDSEDMYRACMAIELLHAFALIHDDIIDNGKERHGKPTTHQFLETAIAQYPRGDKKHISEGLALLAGDLIFSWAGELISSVNDEAVQKIYFRMVEEVVAGQMLDVSLMLQYEVDTATITRKNELKTALYSFVNPLLIGATLAGLSGSSSQHDFYKKLGLSLGQAFQIQDDLLDITGEQSKIGKMPFIDIQDGQHTILSQYIFEKGKPEEKEILMSLFGKQLDDHSRKVLRRLFTSTGATAYAQDQIRLLISSARDLVTSSDLKTEYKEMWNAFINMLHQRSS